MPEKEVITKAQVEGRVKMVVREPKFVILTIIMLRLKRIAVITRRRVHGLEGVVVRLVCDGLLLMTGFLWDSE